MKRSEMVDKITEHLRYARLAGLNNGSDRQEAEFLLTIIEQAGMLPPMNISEVELLDGTKLGKQITLKWDRERE